MHVLAEHARWARRGRRLAKRFLPDRTVIRWQFRRVLGYVPDLARPRTFNEKLQWLKLHYRRPDLPRLVDKYAVRGFVAERIGAGYLNTLLGVWEDPAAIDLDDLPARFVLKATHGSQMNVICRDKAALDWPKAQRKLCRWLAIDYAAGGREWAYHHVPPRVIGEAFLGDGESDLPDYKFFCFGGEPKLVQVDVQRFVDHRRAMFDPERRQLPFELHYRAPDHPVPPPPNLREMAEVARTLSSDLPFCRVDLYSVSGRTIFGEMSLYPNNGMKRFYPDDWDHRLGDWLVLPNGS